jgi:hypothetical protein
MCSIDIQHPFPVSVGGGSSCSSATNVSLNYPRRSISRVRREPRADCRTNQDRRVVNIAHAIHSLAAALIVLGPGPRHFFFAASFRINPVSTTLMRINSSRNSPVVHHTFFRPDSKTGESPVNSRFLICKRTPFGTSPRDDLTRLHR